MANLANPEKHPEREDGEGVATFPMPSTTGTEPELHEDIVKAASYYGSRSASWEASDSIAGPIQLGSDPVSDAIGTEPVVTSHSQVDG